MLLGQGKWGSQGEEDPSPYFPYNFTPIFWLCQQQLKHHLKQSNEIQLTFDLFTTIVLESL